MLQSHLHNSIFICMWCLQDTRGNSQLGHMDRLSWYNFTTLKNLRPTMSRLVVVQLTYGLCCSAEFFWVSLPAHNNQPTTTTTTIAANVCFVSSFVSSQSCSHRPNVHVRTRIVCCCRWWVQFCFNHGCYYVVFVFVLATDDGQTSEQQQRIFLTGDSQTSLRGVPT